MHFIWLCNQHRPSPSFTDGKRRCPTLFCHLSCPILSNYRMRERCFVLACFLTPYNNQILPTRILSPLMRYLFLISTILCSLVFESASWPTVPSSGLISDTAKVGTTCHEHQVSDPALFVPDKTINGFSSRRPTDQPVESEILNVNMLAESENPQPMVSVRLLRSAFENLAHNMYLYRKFLTVRVLTVCKLSWYHFDRASESLRKAHQVTHGNRRARGWYPCGS